MLIWPYKKEAEGCASGPVRRCETIEYSDYRRSRGRPKKSWSEVIRYYLKTLGLVEDMAYDRKL